ncbi:outer membrane protein assembly factor BamB family protein [Paraliomyxa miuraensis]|uniref:outer membrane protein assembly factor BamB family protein n=1 Tax=Paraliomyxa miuraensis TaxID=376150 RepID=UPI00224E45AE|nr:PQQ-binding-like beta-propeller repeat protein [Paraliomyxa miuraensis]MCX4241666.1 PQQ-binding-like beta-propeller repeat protein [Paraliomyxa miuraensis]
MSRTRAWLLGATAGLACTVGRGPQPQEPRPVPPSAVAGDSRSEPPPSLPPEPREPPRLLTDPGSGVFVAWSGAAAASAVAGSELVVVETDLRHLSAYDWRDGEPRWRIELPVSPAVRIRGLDDRVLLHDGDRVVVVEAARGRVLGRHPAPVSSAWPQGHETQLRQGACAWVGQCGIQAFDCADGAPRGPYLASEQLHLYGMSDDPSEHSTSCTPEPWLLGAFGEATVVVASAPAGGASASGSAGGPALLGLDRERGEVVWQQALAEGEASVGATPDGACWLVDRESDDARLRVLDCASGQPRWERALGAGTLEIHGIDGSVVVGKEQGGRWRVSAHATADGRPQWSARLARRQRPLFPEGPIPGAQTPGTRRSYGLVDPSEGRVVGELVAGREESLWRDPMGGFVLIGRDLRELDREGRLVRQRPFTAARVYAVTAAHVLVHEGEAIEIFDRDQLRERARLEGRLSIDATAKLPDDRLLLQRHGEDGVALLLGLDPPARGAGRRE